MDFERLRKLYQSIEEKHKSNESIELIIRASFPHKKRIVEKFKKFGRIKYESEFLPYFSLEIKTEFAYKMTNFVYKNIRNSAFESLEDELIYIESIEPSSKVSIPKPKAPKMANSRMKVLWNLEAIGFYNAMDLSCDARIGIIDTGVDYFHNELSENFLELKGYDFVEEHYSPLDKNGHGTHVAGIICSKNCGIARIAKIYSLRVLDENGAGSEVNVMRAIEWGLKQKLDVLNMSLGSENASSAFEELCNYAYNSGVYLVAAAGNNYFGYNYPAAFDCVISVAAIDQEKRHAYFSNISDKNDISAPGTNILSTFPKNQYAVLDGTSMACPHASAGIAIALSKIRQFNKLYEAESVMKNSAEKLYNNTDYDYESVFGAGLLRLDLMINKIIQERLAFEIKNFFGDFYNGYERRT
ncbi:MAG: S8 family peptidase [Candidatus Woesearchaeota archaeon]